MNANELADLVAEDTSSDLAQETAYTLRKQQAEIEKLKAEVVSYRTDAEKLTMRLIDIAVSVPVKRLSDEEIMEVITMSHSWIDGYPKKYALEFARAILRKAQEK